MRPSMNIPLLHHSEEFKDIYAALIKAQKEFVPVPKTRTANVVSKKTGARYSYKYADLADVLGMALPILTKHGIGVLQPNIMVDGTLRICTRLIHESGQWLMSDGIALSEEQEPQDLGTDSTYYRRYDACSLLAIVAEEDLDGNHEPARTTPAEAERVSIPQPAAVPYSQGRSVPVEANTAEQPRGRVIKRLRALIPDEEMLKVRIKKAFPDYKDGSSIPIEGLEMLLAALEKESQDQEERKNKLPPDMPADVLSMFDDNILTRASKLEGPTIGLGRAKHLLTILRISKAHTEDELKAYIKEIGVRDVPSIPVDLYDEICAWAEGQREPEEVK